MTQSDAPNEGREETRMIGNTKGKRLAESAFKLVQENKELRDQLSKERENVKDWKEKYERLNKDWTYTQNERSKERETIKEKNAWIAEERTINKELAAQNRKLESELIEEREMRKENSKQAFQAGRAYEARRIDGMPNFDEWYESLISKASELDKNQ